MGDSSSHRYRGFKVPLGQMMEDNNCASIPHSALPRPTTPSGGYLTLDVEFNSYPHARRLKTVSDLEPFGPEADNLPQIQRGLQMTRILVLGDANKSN
ncbi:hypothetical protein AVEN_164474-1 [Araneus ventricosus]|uniref:Uncharacterized protein n=1 Tax=Araneus ventricosus TaxID=182803 RepID=A0A4Y2S398_ARAVE|nr:hypothetical protein AVEN_83583-1 [Araneus ventricosus]GBN83249.1 hypothetical protein AVEN_164474-1 [Araneus ventricosus]